AVPHLEAQRAAGTAVHSAGGPDDLFISLFLPHRRDAQKLLTQGVTRTRGDQGAGATGHSRPTQKTPTSDSIKIIQLNAFTKPMDSASEFSNPENAESRFSGVKLITNRLYWWRFCPISTRVTALRSPGVANPPRQRAGHTPLRSPPPSCHARYTAHPARSPGGRTHPDAPSGTHPTSSPGSGSAE